MPAPHKAFAEAFALHKAGDLAKAEPLYRKVLKKADKHFDALHMLGVICLQTGRYDDALKLIGRAISVATPSAAAFNNHGNALQALGRHMDALASYDKALALKPDHAEAMKNRGDALQNLGRHEEAILSYQKTLDFNSVHAEALNNMGASLQALGRYTEALDIFSKAASLKPNYPAAVNNRGDALRLLGRFEEALACYHQAVALAPSLVEPHAQIANTLHEMQRYEEALKKCDEVLRLAPDHLKTLNNRGAILQGLDRYEQSLESLDKAINVNADYAEARWNRALAHLTLGNMAPGWEDYEWRWRKQTGILFPPSRFSQPLWRGEDLADGTLLIYGEQGIGDEVLYAGMVPQLADRGISLVWEADERLVPLIRRTYPGIEAVARTAPPHASTASPAISKHISTASLGQYLRRTLGDFPQTRRPYFQADKTRARGYRDRLLGDQKSRLIGISWASKNEDTGQQKTAVLSEWRSLLARPDPNTRFVDLQYGNTVAERAASGFDIAHLEELDLFNDIDGLAALIAACDLVITVSNTTAHIAGALDVPVWVMVPAGNAKLWYWVAGGEKSPWYPSATVFRQKDPRSWDNVFEAIVSKLPVLTESAT